MYYRRALQAKSNHADQRDCGRQLQQTIGSMIRSNARACLPDALPSAQPHRLHISVRWGIEPEPAIRAFFDARAQLVWLPQKECFETRTVTHILVWLRVAPQHILLITCVPRELSQSALAETEEESA